jgi:hypothetical protein
MNPARKFLRVSILLSATMGLAGLAGCGMGNQAVTMDAAGPRLTGLVHGGQNPVAFGHLALFATTSAAATGGAAAATLYGGNVTPIAVTTSDSNGNFQFAPGYNCPGGQQAYVVSTGGNPGLTVGTDNAAIFLVAALGPCAGLGSVGVVTVNEVTTVAAAYALSGFAPVGGVGMTEAAVIAGTAMPGITTSSTNVQGLADGFANAANVVSVNTGLAYVTSPSGGAVMQSTIHALGDILQNCVNSLSPASAVCAALFAAAQPPAATGIAKPVNVWQAALDIARFPGNNVATLYGLLSAQAAFAESLTAAPNDWTVGVVYTSTLLASASGLGISATDQVYVSGSGYLLSFTPQGSGGAVNLLAGKSGITSSNSLREIVFDKLGNLFFTDGAYTGVHEYTPSTGALTQLNFNVAPVSEANANTYGIAMDGLNDVWTSSYSKATCATVTCPLVEFAAGTAYSPYSSFSGISPVQPTGALGGARGIAFDVNTGNVWVTAIDDDLAEVFTVTPSATGAATAAAAPVQVKPVGIEPTSPATNTACGSISVAIDAASNAWIVEAGGSACATPGSLTEVSKAGAVLTTVSGGELGASGVGGQVVIDGNGTLFVAETGSSQSTSAVVAYSPSLAAYLSPNIGFNPGATYAGGALSGGSLYEPSYLQVDRSGALWLLSSGSGTTHPANLIQVLGVAAPTDPVQADGNYGVKP